MQYRGLAEYNKRQCCNRGFDTDAVLHSAQKTERRIISKANEKILIVNEYSSNRLEKHLFKMWYK